MNPSDRWLLPEGIDEVLPPTAWQLEQLRRTLLDLYHSWGYEFVIPPFIEFLESLLTGAGHDLDLQTFKLTDQLSGRMMGVRADMTPQVARIVARQPPSTPSRLCYMGTVLHTRSDGFGSSRSPLQVGAELYGHQGIESDLEIISLMLASLDTAMISGVHLDLGHVAIFRSLVQQAQLDPDQESLLFDHLQRKAPAEITAQLHSYSLAPTLTEMLLALTELHGDQGILTQARQRLAAAQPEVSAALTVLEQLSAALKQRFPDLPIHFDLAELRGYHYHTGVLFAAYVADQGQEIARGGRYDSIGQVFGHACPATGFSADLKTLLTLGQSSYGSQTAIFAPADDDPQLQHYITQLRQQGERVIQALSHDADEAAESGCQRLLHRTGATWTIVNL